MNEKKSGGHGLRLLQILTACLIGLTLAGCLESDEPPTLNAKDLVRVSALEGIFKDPFVKEGGGSNKYFRFTPQANNHYVVSAITWDITTQEITVDPKTIDMVLLALRATEPKSKLFLAVATDVREGVLEQSKTLYLELRQMGKQFSWSAYQIEPEQMPAANTIASKKNIMLTKGTLINKLAGSLTSHSLQELFSDALFRKTLTTKYSTLQALSSDEKRAFIAAGLYDVTGNEDSAKEVLPPVKAPKVKEPNGGLAWLQGKSNGGDMWAKFFLARAHFHVAGKVREQQLTEQFRGLAYPENTRVYWDAYQAILRDQNFTGSYETAVQLAEEGLKISFPPLVNLKGVMKLNGLGLSQDQAGGSQLVLQAADGGLPNAMTLAGRLYLSGEGVQKDEAEALRWFRKGAAAGRADAMYSLAMMYDEGLGVSKDEAETVRWYRKAAELGHAAAMLNLGLRYANGRGVTKDEATAVQWYRKAAELGDAQAMFILGVMYADGRRVAKDEAEAERWYRKAAELGHVDAMFILGVGYATGHKMLKDEAEAVRWYRKAADMGDKAAMRNLGMMYADGRGVAKDEATGVQWYRKAAELGDASAMFILGAMYGNGRGVAKDEAMAVQWYRKAAELGDASAMFALGVMYADGRGVAKDEAEAERWYLKAAEGGNAHAMSSLGHVFLNGQGAAKDDSKAFKWFQKAAESGDAHGMTSLGYMYTSGRGVKKNDAEAVRWYQKAAALGESTAMSNLGVQYENGSGVTKDLKQALEWYQMAAGLGNENAKQAIQRLQTAASSTMVTSNQGVGTTTRWRSAQEWADAYRNAPAISKADFLKLVKSARLSFSVSPELVQHVSLAKLLERVRTVIEREGVRIDEKAPVTIKIKWGFEHHTVVKTTERTGNYGYSKEEQKHTVLVYSSILQFELTTPLYRNGRFYNRRVIPTSSGKLYYDMAGDDAIERAIRQDAVDGLAEGVADAFAEIRKSTTIQNNGGTLQWGVDANTAMFKSYTDAKQVSSDDLDRVFTEVNGISELDIELTDDAGLFVNKTNVHNRWANTMSDAKWSYIENGTGKVRHQLTLLKVNASKLQTLFGDLFYIPFGVMLSHIAITEDNTIEMDGRLFRLSNIRIWEEFKHTGALWDQVETTFSNLAYGSIKDSLNEARFRR